MLQGIDRCCKELTDVAGSSTVVDRCCRDLTIPCKTADLTVVLTIDFEVLGKGIGSHIHAFYATKTGHRRRSHC